MPARIAVAALAVALAVACADGAPPRNAILIVLDTLRADGLSAYGNPRPTSPVIDRLAGEGVLFETVVTNATWTAPAVVGLLAGRYPTQRVFRGKLRVSIVESLRDAGFATAAFTGGVWVSAHFGIDRGFEHFVAASDEFPEPGDLASDIEPVFGAAKRWLERNAERPFFLLIHTYECHIPYRRPLFTEGLPRGDMPGPLFGIEAALQAGSGEITLGETELAYIRALYDGGVAESDHAIGELLATLGALGLADETLIVVTSDHGEHLGERAPAGSHGTDLYDQLALVPLVIHDPTRSWPVRRVRSQVRTVDTLPTILDLLGVPPVPGADGRSLVPLMLGDEREHRPAWLRITPSPVSPDGAVALRTGTHKLIAKGTDPAPSASSGLELYDLGADAGERANLAARDGEETARLLRRLEETRSRLDAEGVPDFKSVGAAGLNKWLRALGYAE